MERFLSDLNITDAALIAKLEATIHTCNIAPDGFLPAGLPEKTWVFVEKGFLKHLESYKNIVDITHLHPDGTSILLLKASTGPDSMACYCLQAIEPSTLYYLLPKEVDDLCIQFPGFGIAYMNQIGMAAGNANRRSSIWNCPASERFEHIKSEFPYLLRAGPGPLADYFRLTGKAYTALRAYFN